MTRLFALLGLLLPLALEASAYADGDAPPDNSITSFDPDSAVAPVTSVEGPGVTIGENFVVHPVAGIETGYVSNVFYSSTNPQAAAVLRGLVQLSAGSPTGDRLKPADASSDAAVEPDFIYRLGARATWDEYLSGNSTVRGTSGLALGGNAHLVFNPSGVFTFGLDDDYQRTLRAANFETSENVNRDINNFAANLLWHPADRSISAYAYYDNRLDIFEQSYGIYPSRLFNQLGLHPQWKIFPETQVFIDASIGFYTAVDSDAPKNDSFPFVIVGGVQTLLTLNTTLTARAGYTNGFYTGGPSYSAPTMGFEVGYRYSPFGRVTLGYDWLYSDSINANYYRDHEIHALLTQELKPVTFVIQPQVYFREYTGIDTIVPGAQPVRDDIIFSLVAGVHYSFRNWLAATLDYRLTDDTTNYRYPETSAEPFDPSYVRHEILLGVRLAK